MYNLRQYDSSSEDEDAESALQNRNRAQIQISEESDYFGLKDVSESSSGDELNFETKCEHTYDCRTLSRESCWKCNMKIYENEGLKKRVNACGPRQRQKPLTGQAETAQDRKHKRFSSKQRSYVHFGDISTKGEANHSTVSATSSKTVKECLRFVKHSQIKNFLSEDQVNARNVKSKIPSNVWRSTGASKERHGGCVSELQWHPVLSLSQFFMSCSFDGYVKIWDVYNHSDNNLVCLLSKQICSSAVRCAKWNFNGRNIACGDFDRKATVVNAETGSEELTIPQPNMVTSISYHPSEPDLLIVGCYGQINCWDLRRPASKPIKTFRGNFDQVRDMAFLRDKKTLVCCTDTVDRESADKTIMAWNFDSQTLLSNQIYQERYTCTSIKVHPTDSVFLAQTNGNYVASFSTNSPYKLNKKKRYFGHKVAGYGVSFDISADGKLIVSGSTDGRLYYYDYFDGKLLKTINVTEDGNPTIAVNTHPVLPSVVSVGSWNGNVNVYK